MRFGLQINPYFAGATGNAWDAVERAALYADGSALDSLWLYDHFLYEGGYSGHPHPAPTQQPHPPILVGGSGEKMTLRIVARYAQLCNVAGDPEQVARLFGVLREHCRSVGRPYDEITRSIFTTVIVGRDAAEVAAKR